MDSPERYKSTVAFTDLLFNILVGFVFLFLIAFILINPVAKKGDIVVPAEIIITLTWPDESADDIDLWVRSPDGELVGFSRKTSNLMNLDRDDLGEANDKIDINGQETILRLNREVATVRGKMQGEYHISVHWYRKASGDKVKHYDSLPVTVEVAKINPFVIIYKQTLQFSEEGQVHNYYKFNVDQNNNILNVVDSEENIVPLINRSIQEQRNIVR